MSKQTINVCALLFCFFLLASWGKKSTASTNKNLNLFSKTSPEGGNETELVNTPHLSFNLNVSQVTSLQNFLATCNIDRWYGANRKDYVVHFYRTNGDDVAKELVGAHEVYAPSENFPNGRHLFIRGPTVTDVLISAGNHFTGTTFDLVGSPKSVEIDRVYWCELTDRSAFPVKTYRSNIWDRAPAVVLSISKTDGLQQNRYLARCKVRQLNANSAYRLTFATAYPNRYIFGTYIKKFNGPTELELPPVPQNYRQGVGHGDHFELPIFELLFDLTTTSSEKYFCRLINDSNDQNPNWKIVTSNHFYFTNSEN